LGKADQIVSESRTKLKEENINILLFFNEKAIAEKALENCHI